MMSMEIPWEKRWTHTFCFGCRNTVAFQLIQTVPYLWWERERDREFSSSSFQCSLFTGHWRWCWRLRIKRIANHLNEIAKFNLVLNGIFLPWSYRARFFRMWVQKWRWGVSFTSFIWLCECAYVSMYLECTGRTIKATKWDLVSQKWMIRMIADGFGIRRVRMFVILL